MSGACHAAAKSVKHLMILDLPVPPLPHKKNTSWHSANTF
jgi:hypothetical protein